MGSRWVVGVCVLGLFSTLAGAAGCGGQPEPEALESNMVKEGLVDLQKMLQGVSAANQMPPRNLQELAPLDPLHPVAAVGIQNGTIVYAWGKTVNSAAPNASNVVIAYDAKAVTEGGWVLLQDGTIKQMTADEFKAVAPPAATK